MNLLNRKEKTLPFVGDLIKSIREDKNWSQTDLAKQVQCSPTYVARIEANHDLPSDAFLARFIEVVELEEKVAALVFLLAWIERFRKGIQPLEGAKEPSEARTRGAIRTRGASVVKPGEVRPRTLPIERILSSLMTHDLRWTAESALQQKAMPGSLEDFPQTFRPLKVICGDRRDEKAKTIGDLFIESACPLDVAELIHLDLPPETEVWSDKVLLLETNENLQKEFGQCHLLILSSPAANFGTRICNRFSLFTFAMHHKLFEIEQMYQKLSGFRFHSSSKIQAAKVLIENYPHIDLTLLTKLRDLDDLAAENMTASHRDVLGVLIRDFGLNSLNELPRELQRRDLDDEFFTLVKELREANFKSKIIHLRKSGFEDPILAGRGHQEFVRGFVTHEHRDYAVISLGVNPFAQGRDYLAIIVAGVHMPGTLAAVRLLAHPQAFGDHPFGGVIKVDVPVALPWSQRLKHLLWNWDTENYTPEEALRGLKTIADWVREMEDNHPEGYQQWRLQGLELCLVLLTQMSQKNQ